METKEGVVEFSFRPWSFLFPRGLLPLLMGAGLVWILVEGDVRPFMIGVYSLMLITQLLPPLIGFWSARRHPVAVRLSDDGIEWTASKVHREWRDIAAVRLRSQKGGRRWLPGLLLVSPRELDFARRSNTPPPGLGVDTSHLEVDREDVVAAILRFVDVPVYRD